MVEDTRSYKGGPEAGADSGQRPTRFPTLPKPLAWLGSKAAGAVLTAAVAAAFTAWFIEKPDSLASQIDALKAEQNRSGRQVAFEEQADLHGTGTKSYVFLFKDESIGRPDLSAGDPGQSSDLLRIYDYKPSGLFRRRELSEQFSFAPSGHPYQFIVDSIKDWDRDGRPEVVGSYWGLSEDTSASMPVFIRWDASGSYRIFPVLSNRDLLPPIPQDPYRFAYLFRHSLVDRRADVSVHGYAVDNPLVQFTDRGPILIGAYVAGREGDIPSKFRLHAWSLDFRRSTPIIKLCTFGSSDSGEPDGGLTIDAGQLRSESRAIRQVVERNEEELYC